MTLTDHWDMITNIFEKARQSSLHYAVATVDQDGNPHVSPIGSLILRDDCTGYYFEQFPNALKENLNITKNCAVLAINSNPDFWFESLSNGEFKTFPGIRLMGTSCGVRTATPEEINTWQERVRHAEGLIGHRILWKDMKTIRELKFNSFKPVLCGDMTNGLLKSKSTS